MNRWLVGCVLVVLLFGNVAGALAAPPADSIYVVQPGDTLSVIAYRFGISLTAVAQANHITNYNLIFVGQRLTIPGAVTSGGTGGSTNSAPTPAPASGSSPCASTIVVQRGDTLGLIASRCATSVGALVAANGIANVNLIFVGQRLTIPGGVDASLPPTTPPVPPASTPAATPPPAGSPPAPVGPLTIANPSFEGGWSTDGYGNQTPNGWTRYAPPAGSVLAFPTKGQKGTTVRAVSDGLGENVHKLSHQLPPEEQFGQSRALILDGDTVYKSFDLYHAHSLELSQVISGPPGHSVRVTVYILGETHDTPCKSCTHLEDDHFLASVRLGSAEDRRTYATMKTHYDVSGNERNWNKFVVVTAFPDSGQLPLAIIVQQNWAGKVDFFIDNVHADLVN